MYTWPTSPQLSLHSHLTILCKSSEALSVQVLGAGYPISSGLSWVTLGSQFLPVLYPGSLPSWLLQQPSSSCCRDLRGNCSAGSSYSSSGIFPGYKLNYTDTSNDFPHVFETLTYIYLKEKRLTKRLELNNSLHLGLSRHLVVVPWLVCYVIRENETKQKLSGNFPTMNQFLRFYEIFKILDFRKITKSPKTYIWSLLS